MQFSYIQEVVALLKAQANTNSTRVLDLGCGTGNYAVALAQSGFDVTGIDAAPGMLAHAHPKVSTPLASRLRFQQMNLHHRLPFPDHHFDHVIAISVLQALNEPEATCDEVWRVMKPGGSFVILHVPKPDYQSVSLVQDVRRRLQHLKRKTLRNAALVTLKCWVERRGGTRYWTDLEVQQMLEKRRFILQSIDTGPPIIAVAQKPSK